MDVRHAIGRDHIAQQRAKNAVRKQIDELRATGQSVVVLQDAHILAVVRVTGDDGESVEMLIDPLGVTREARQRANA